MWKWEAEGKAKAVIAIVHSAYEHHRRYAWTIEQFRNSGFHVVMGDLPGHGEDSSLNEAHDEDFELYSKYVKQLVEVSMADSLPVFVMGHGMGATLVMHALQTQSIECAGVILTSPWLNLRIQPSKLSGALANMGKLADHMKSTHEISIKELTRNYDVYVQEKDDPLFTNKITLKWYRELQNLKKNTVSSVESISNIPVLLMTGERDKVTDPVFSEDWLSKQKLCEYQFKEWKNAYHDLFHEPERENVYYYTESFMHNVLRSIGYII